MKTWLRKTSAAAQSDSISFRHWRELVDDFDFQIEYSANQETEEAVVDLWLEDPRSFMEGLEMPEGQQSAARRVKTGGNGLRRHDPMVRTAAATRWDSEFSEAKNHVDQVLKNLGNSARE